jgi:DNA mismatch endonuclease (patch repair protein)
VVKKNIKPNVIVRSLLHRMGFRFNLNGGGLPGKPDIVLPRWKAVIFVCGCSQHVYNRNKNAIKKLENMGWRVCVVWKHEIDNPVAVAQRLNVFLHGRFVSAQDTPRINRMKKLSNEILRVKER